MTSLHLHPFTTPLTKGHQGSAASFIAGAQAHLGVISLSTNGVGMYEYLPINYIILHDEFMQWALNLEPGTGHMYHWHHPMLLLLLFLLGKMVLQEGISGPMPCSAIHCQSGQGPLLLLWPW